MTYSECMHCNLCCGGGGTCGSGDRMQNCYLHCLSSGGGLLPKAVAHILNACIVTCAVVVVVALVAAAVAVTVTVAIL